MLKVLRFRLAGLWHSEYPLVIKRLIGIIARFNPGALHLQRAYDKLAGFIPRLDKIEKQEAADADSVRLCELDQIRDTLFSVIMNVADNFKRTPMAEYAEAAKTVLNLLKKHGLDIPAANYTSETKRMYDMIANFRKLPEAMAALSLMALTPLLDRMEAVNKEFDTLFMNRHESQSNTERVDPRAIRTECDKAVTSMWNAVEFCIEEYGEAPYKDMVNAVNKYNAYYKQQLAARATRRATKNDVAKEKPIPPPEE